MDRCTGRCDIAEIPLKTALNTIQSINQLSWVSPVLGWGSEAPCPLNDDCFFSRLTGSMGYFGQDNDMDDNDSIFSD